MTLNDYLAAAKMSGRAFALRAGLTESTVSRIRRGLNLPDEETLRAVHKATGGQVTPNDFFQLHSATTKKRGAA